MHRGALLGFIFERFALFDTLSDVVTIWTGKVLIHNVRDTHLVRFSHSNGMLLRFS